MSHTLEDAIQLYKNNNVKTVSHSIDIEINDSHYKTASIRNFALFLQDPTVHIKSVTIQFYYSRDSVHSFKKFINQLLPVFDKHHIYYSFIFHTVLPKYLPKKDSELKQVFIKEIFTHRLNFLDLKANTLNTLLDGSFAWFLKAITTAKKLQKIEMSACQVELLSTGVRLKALQNCILKHPSLYSIFASTIINGKTLNKIELFLFSALENKSIPAFDHMQEPRVLRVQNSGMPQTIDEQARDVITGKSSFIPPFLFSRPASDKDFQASDTCSEITNLQSHKSRLLKTSSPSFLITHRADLINSNQLAGLQNSQSSFKNISVADKADLNAYDALYSCNPGK